MIYIILSENGPARPVASELDKNTDIHFLHELRCMFPLCFWPQFVHGKNIFPWMKLGYFYSCFPRNPTVKLWERFYSGGCDEYCLRGIEASHPPRSRQQVRV